MRERIPAMALRSVGAGWVFFGLGLLMAVGLPIFGIIVLVHPELLESSTASSGLPPEAAVHSAIASLPIGVQGALYCMLGCIGAPLLLFEFLTAVGRVGHLELAERPTGVLVLSRGTWWPWRFVRRFEIPRGSAVDVLVAPAGRSGYGMVKAFSVQLAVGGSLLKGFETRLAGANALKRVSLVPLRSAVERQGGRVVAHDRHAQAMLEPAPGR